MSLLSIIFPGFGDIVEITGELIRQSREEQQEAKREKRSLLDKLEHASGEEIFKYMNLISFANMDEFVAQSRLHAQQSFKISLLSAIAGFFVILISIGFAIYFQIAGIEGMTASYLGSVVGLLTEAISAIFFALYARTTVQVNRLHDRLLGSQSAYSAIISTSLITDADARQNQIIELSNQIMARAKDLDKIQE